MTDNDDIGDEIAVLAAHQYSRRGEGHLPCTRQDGADTTVNFQPYPIMIDKADHVEFLIIADFALEKRKDKLCSRMKRAIGTTNCRLTSDRNGPPVMKAYT